MSAKLMKRPRCKSYSIQVWIPAPVSKMKWISTGTSNKREAQVILKKYVDAEFMYKFIKKETSLPDELAPTLYDAISKYLKSVEIDPDQSPSTLKLKTFCLNDFMNVIGEHVRVDQLGQEDAEKYDKYLRTKKRQSGAFKGTIGLSESTINIRKRNIKAFLNWCLSEQKWIKEISMTLKQSKPILDEPNTYDKTYW